MTRYLGFQVGFKTSTKDRFQKTLMSLGKKLSYWCTTKLSLASRVLVANQVLLASTWYIASYWSQNLRSINKVKALIRNYIWSGEDGERNCRAKVA
jgi:hypothetical protein